MEVPLSITPFVLFEMLIEHFRLIKLAACVHIARWPDLWAVGVSHEQRPGGGGGSSETFTVTLSGGGPMP